MKFAPQTHILQDGRTLLLREAEAGDASQALACIRTTPGGIPYDKVNPYGGAMALGHPMGATGAFLTCKVLDYLQDPETAGTYGMVTMCIGGGMGACGIYELCK